MQLISFTLCTCQNAAFKHSALQSEHDSLIAHRRIILAPPDTSRLRRVDVLTEARRCFVCSISKANLQRQTDDVVLWRATDEPILHLLVSL